MFIHESTSVIYFSQESSLKINVMTLNVKRLQLVYNIIYILYSSNTEGEGLANWELPMICLYM
jgi:hypothetical protein